MAKERGESSMSSERAWPLFSSPSPTEKEIQEWDDAKCPICIEPPHNAILLICSSHRNGCRPFICNTDSRLSNCYHQFRGTPRRTRLLETRQGSEPAIIRHGSIVLDLWGARSDAVSHEEGDISNLCLQCPLCRGRVLKWTTVQSARSYMNSKTRSCSSETCDFVGAYEDLQRHARDVHPDVRPREVDPARVQRWMTMEHETALADVREHLHFHWEHGFVDGGMQIMGMPVPLEENELELNRLILEHERELQALHDMRESYYRRIDQERGQDLMSFIFNGRRGMPLSDHGIVYSRSGRPLLSVDEPRNPFVEGSGRIRYDVRNGYSGTGLARNQNMPGPHMMHPHMSFSPPVGREIQPPRPREGEHNVYTGNIPRALRSQPIYRHAGNGNIHRERGSSSSSSMGAYGARSENRPEPANGPVSSWSDDYMLATAQNDVWMSIDFSNAAPRNPSQTVMGHPPMSIDFGNYDDDYNGYDDYEYEEDEEYDDDYDVEVD